MITRLTFSKKSDSSSILGLLGFHFVLQCFHFFEHIALFDFLFIFCVSRAHCSAAYGFQVVSFFSQALV